MALWRACWQRREDGVYWMTPDWVHWFKLFGFER